MFSALKKLTAKPTGEQNSPSAQGNSWSQMPGQLQRKFAKGVHYNMKIVIRGDRNVGKTCLFERLQGRPFKDQYSPTEQIQVAPIQWSFKNTEDIVKVEVWDVVDEGKPKASTKSQGLKLSAQNPAVEQPILDAAFLDVYKGTNGVLLMFDITKQWTFDYVIREVSKIPGDIPVLILGNHCDMTHHRVVSLGQAHALVEEINEKRATNVLYSESSMRNGFGLRLLHKFLGLPFLQLKKQSLLAQLEKNDVDKNICVLEMNEFLKSDNADYAKFLDALSQKRREAADQNSIKLDTVHSANGANLNSELAPTKSIIVGGGRPIVPVQGGKEPKIDEKLPKAKKIVQDTITSPVVTNSLGMIRSVDDFCPEDGSNLDKSFLDELDAADRASAAVGYESESDTEGKCNPLVARFDEDYTDLVVVESPKKTVEEKPRVNPLAKSKPSDLEVFPSITERSRRSSSDSLELKADYSESFVEIDSDCSKLDTKLRRSPDGIEDTATTTQSCASYSPAEEADTEPKDKEKKKKSKKKSKEQKSEKREKREKKKKKEITSDDEPHRQDSYETL